MRLLLACSVLLLGVVACVSTPESDPVQGSAQVSSEVQVAPATDGVAPDITALACKKPDHVCKRGKKTACCLPNMNCTACLGTAAADETTDDADAPASDDAAADTAVPEELQLPESAASCKRRGGVCTNIHLCVGSGHHTIPVTCPNQNACCV